MTSGLHAPGCDTFDSVESYIHFISAYFMAKFEILIKLMCNYYQSKNQRNLLSDKSCTVQLSDHPSLVYSTNMLVFVDKSINVLFSFCRSNIRPGLYYL